jgi:LCP family protein required for cell wall assembly
MPEGPSDLPDPQADASPAGDPAVPGNAVRKPGARRGKARKRHTVGKVLLATMVVLGMVTGLGTVWLYRDLNDNIQVLDVGDQLYNEPDKPESDEPQEPLNILVMGSDDRDGAGNNIDGLTGSGQRSDTTLLFHLSGDRQSAYGVSIPRDSLVTRPDCLDEDGETIPGAEDAMWNEAFAVGGPACTIQQFQTLTDIKVDHFVVVDFAGFQGMVDAIDGVSVCIPEDISDPAHGINISAGTRDLRGKEALNYVRARYTLGDGSDIGRVKRQQAFIASMANKVVSGGVLGRPDRLVRFLQAATESLTVDPGMDNVVKLSKIGLGFQDIGLNKIRFITIPWAYDTREEYRGRVVWTDDAPRVWKRVLNDQPMSRGLDSGTIDAGNLPGAPSSSGSASGSPSQSPSGSPSVSPSESPTSQAGERAEAEREALESAGLCA